MARYDDLHTSTIAYATFVSSVLLLVIILLIRALCYAWVEGESDRKLADAHYVSADAEISAQKERVAAYGTSVVEVAPPAPEDGAAQDGGAAADAAPQTEERIQIPIDKAKEILLKELSGQ